MRAIQPVLAGRLTLVLPTWNFIVLKQSVMLDRAFVIGNGSGREVFYQTWSCRRSTRIAEGGVTGTSNANNQAFIPLLVISAIRQLQKLKPALRKKRRSAATAVRRGGYRAIGWLIP